MYIEAFWDLDVGRSTVGTLQGVSVSRIAVPDMLAYARDVLGFNRANRMIFKAVIKEMDTGFLALQTAKAPGAGNAPPPGSAAANKRGIGRRAGSKAPPERKRRGK